MHKMRRRRAPAPAPSRGDAKPPPASPASAPLLRPARGAWEALHRRPWLTRLPATACLRTRPACATCGAGTGISDRFCCECGASTIDRVGVEEEGGDGALVPPECALTSADATRQLRARLGREDVTVHVTDVHVGARSVLTDAHGRLWRDYDPLRHVAFCGRDGSVIGMAPTPFHVPAVRHVRT